MPRLLRASVLHIPLLVLGVVIGTYALFWARLPEPIAVHWGSGRPNGSMSRAGSLALFGGLWMFFTVQAAWSTIKRQDGERWSSQLVPPLTMLYFVGGVLLASHGSILWANVDAAGWKAARHIETVPAVVVILGFGLSLGAAGRLVERRISAGGSSARTPTPALALGSSERAVWFGHSRNNWLLLASLGTSAVIILVSPPSAGALGRYAIPIVVSVAGMLFSAIHVRVGNDRLTIELGAWRWPRRSIDLRDIAEVEVRQIQPLRNGGWGYRFCGRRCRAYIVRAGEALVMSHQDGRTTIVTVDGAEEGATLLMALKERLRA